MKRIANSGNSIKVVRIARVFRHQRNVAERILVKPRNVILDARIGGVIVRFELMRQTYCVQRSNEECLRQDKCMKWE